MLKRYLIIGIAACVVGAALFAPDGRVSLASQSNPWAGEYFQNKTLSGSPDFTRDDPVLSFEWGYNPPIEGWTITSNYSARWTINDSFGSGNYTFAARVDDGVRMWVDGQLVIDEWHDEESGDWHAVDKVMKAGKHQVKVEYYQHDGWAAIYAGYYPSKPPTAVVVTPGPSPTPRPPTVAPTLRPTRTPSLYGTVSSSGSQPTAEIVPPAGFGGSGVVGAQGGITPGPNDVMIEFNVNKYATWEGFPGPALHKGGQSGDFGYIKNRQSKPTFRIQWNIVVAQSGYYDLYVFVPSGQNVTQSAAYRIFTNGALGQTLALDQSAKPNQWVFLGSFYFVAGAAANQHVYLDNVTSEESGTRNVLLDAVRLVFKP